MGATYAHDEETVAGEAVGVLLQATRPNARVADETARSLRSILTLGARLVPQESRDFTMILRRRLRRPVPVAPERGDWRRLSAVKSRGKAGAEPRSPLRANLLKFPSADCPALIQISAALNQPRVR